MVAYSLPQRGAVWVLKSNLRVRRLFILSSTTFGYTSATLSSSCSPVLADGKIITQNRSAIQVIRATPEKFELLGKATLPLSKWASPAIADGRLYLRQQKNVACYDLTRPNATTAPAAPLAVAPSPPSSRRS
jgi:hypothetical protein